MKVRIETADPGARRTLEGLLALCGIADPEEPESETSGPLLCIADAPPRLSSGLYESLQDGSVRDDTDGADGEVRLVLLLPRDSALSAGEFTDGQGGPARILRTPILLEEGAEVLLEAARHPVRESVRTERDPGADREAVEFDGRIVSWRGRTAVLTHAEAAYFRLLYERRGETVSREELRAAPGRNTRNARDTDPASAGSPPNGSSSNGSPLNGASNLTDVYMGYLRRKLRPLFGDGAVLSVRGRGYVLRLPADADDCIIP